jgi:ElaB/YqjD/DUF883 family membrane-anchored ribosome-binding protein
MNTAVVELFDGVDDLIRRVADTESPEIRKVRAKVHAALVVAKSACQIESRPAAPRAVAQIEPAMAEDGTLEIADDWLSQYSPPTLGVALLVGLSLGLMLRQ